MQRIVKTRTMKQSHIPTLTILGPLRPVMGNLRNYSHVASEIRAFYSKRSSNSDLLRKLLSL